METFNIILSSITAITAAYVVPVMFYYWWWLDPKRFDLQAIFGVQSLFLLGVVCGKLAIGLTSALLVVQMLRDEQFPTLWTLPGRILFLVACLMHLFCDLRVRLPMFMETENRRRGEDR